MLEFDFPYLATVISGVLSFILGIFWYQPKVLGSRWLAARGKDHEAFKPAIKSLVISFLLWMLAACFYSFLSKIIEINELPEYFLLSCLLWVAFAMPPLLMGALYTGYSFEAVSIDAAYQLAGYYVFALVHIALNTMSL